MVYYKDNKNLPRLKTVTTIKGDTEYRMNTKYVREKYYTINRDVFQFDDKWHTIDSGNIIFDHELGTYVLKNRTMGLIRGIEANLETGTRDGDGFTANPYNNVPTNSNEFGRVTAINHEIIEKEGWFEDLGTNSWLNEKDYPGAHKLQRRKIRNDRGFTDRGYNIEDNNDYPTKMKLHDKYPMVISAKAKEMNQVSWRYYFRCRGGIT